MSSSTYGCTAIIASVFVPMHNMVCTRNMIYVIPHTPRGPRRDPRITPRDPKALGEGRGHCFIGDPRIAFCDPRAFGAGRLSADRAA
eukprot:7581502-Pyramimonas_sp.AAC.1